MNLQIKEIGKDFILHCQRLIVKFEHIYLSILFSMRFIKFFFNIPDGSV